MKLFNLFLYLISLTFATTTFAQSSPESCDCQPNIPGFTNYLNSLNLNENAPLRFEVQNANSTYAILHGTIDGTTPNVVTNFINTYPNVNTLIFMQIPGSDDDAANLVAARLLRNRGYTHYLPAVNAYNEDAFIASGGVDLFLSGTRRIIDPQAEVGVHAWSDGTNEATDFPNNSPEHASYIDYYVEMGFSQADAATFYFFTINAAPAADIHNMTEAELEQYKMRTCKYAANPNYIVTVNGGTLTADLADAVSYQWHVCAGDPILNATSQSFTPTQGGSYDVLVTENNCNNYSNCYTANTALAIEAEEVEEQEEVIGITIFPNPTTDLLYIKAARTDRAFRLTNQYGQILLEGKSMPESIDLTGFPVGFYYLKIGREVFMISMGR
ncbi:MAG: hypothetical protein AB8G22_08790 [Saprospiraceae bacterium]